MQTRLVAGLNAMCTLGMMALMVVKTDRQKAMELIGEMQNMEEKERILFLLTETMK